MNLLNSALSMRPHGLCDGIKSPQKMVDASSTCGFPTRLFFLYGSTGCRVHRSIWCNRNIGLYQTSYKTYYGALQETQTGTFPLTQWLTEHKLIYVAVQNE